MSETHTTPNGLMFEIYEMGSADRQHVCSPEYPQPRFKAARALYYKLGTETFWTKDALIDRLDEFGASSGPRSVMRASS